jgi:hypothetical protein
MEQAEKSVMPTPPPNPHEFKTRFHQFIMRRENRGFNAAFARHRQDRDDSYVSRMHSPFEPDVKFWLHEAAEQLHNACKASVTVGKFALSLLAEVVQAHGQDTPACEDELDAAWYHFKSVRARHAANMCDAEEYDEARNILTETLARVQTGVTVLSRGEQGLADRRRDLNVSRG